MIKFSYNDMNIKFEDERPDDVLGILLGLSGMIMDRGECVTEVPSSQRLNVIERIRMIDEILDSNAVAEPISVTPLDNAMKTRIPNVIDLSELEITGPKKYSGFRCPKCHQSMFIKILDAEKAPRMLMRTRNGLIMLKDGFDFSTKTAEDYDSIFESVDLEEMSKHMDDDANDMVLFKDSSLACECPRCKAELSLDSFIDEYETTTSEFENPCPRCGGEIVPINIDNTSNSMEGEEPKVITINKCEDCGTILY